MSDTAYSSSAKKWMDEPAEQRLPRLWLRLVCRSVPAPRMVTLLALCAVRPPGALHAPLCHSAREARGPVRYLRPHSTIRRGKEGDDAERTVSFSVVLCIPLSRPARDSFLPYCSLYVEVFANADHGYAGM